MKHLFCFALLAWLAFVRVLAGCGPENDFGPGWIEFDDGQDGFATVQGPIVGGNEADEDAYPFMASVQVKAVYSDGTYYGHTCGGVLVAAEYVLTAAHCVKDWSNGTIAQAKIGSCIISISEIYIHPLYDAATGDYDVAILKLEEPCTGITPIHIASSYNPSDRALWSAGKTATVLGWGWTVCNNGSNSDTLKQAELTIEDDKDAARAYTSDNFTFNDSLHVVVSGTNSIVYKGDSGGPLLVRKDETSPWRTVGVASQSNCMEKYAVYTRIGEFGLNRWIHSVLHNTPLVGDVNGDGKDDIVSCTHEEEGGAVRVGVSTGSGFFLPKPFPPTQIWRANWAKPGDIVALGDFNGDGKDDLFRFDEQNVQVALSNGSTFEAGPTYGVPLDVNPSDVILVGDVTGDEKDDVVIFTHDTNADVFVMKSLGGYIAIPSPPLLPKTMWQTYCSPTGETPMLADVNGDGKKDVVSFRQGMAAGPFSKGGNEVFVFLSTGSSFSGGIVWKNDFVSTSEVPAVGQFDLGVKADILKFTRDNNKDVYMASSNGTTAFGMTTLMHDNFGNAMSTLLIGDVNGDGLDDILEFTQDIAADVFIAINKKRGFGVPEKWHPYFAP